MARGRSAGRLLQRQDRQSSHLRPRAVGSGDRQHQRRTGAVAGRRRGGVGLLGGYLQRQGDRSLGSSAPWPRREPADAGGDRTQLDRLGDGLQARPGPIRRDLFPRRRPRRCEMGRGRRVRRAGGAAERALRGAAAHRDQRRLRAVRRPAEERGADAGAHRAADSHLQLSGLRRHWHERVQAAQPVFAPQRRQRRLLFVAAAADHQHAPEDPDQQSLAVHGRHPSGRLAARKRASPSISSPTKICTSKARRCSIPTRS